MTEECQCSYCTEYRRASRRAKHSIIALVLAGVLLLSYLVYVYA